MWRMKPAPPSLVRALTSEQLMVDGLVQMTGSVNMRALEAKEVMRRVPLGVQMPAVTGESWAGRT